MQTSTDKLLSEAIQAARGRDLDQARTLLARVLLQDPDLELGWLWLSEVVASDTERQDCLKHVLRINPDHAAARLGLAYLQSKAVSSPRAEQPAPKSVGVPQADTVPAQMRVGEFSETDEDQERDESAGVSQWFPGAPEPEELDEQKPPVLPVTAPEEGSWTVVQGRSSVALARAPAAPRSIPRRRSSWLAFTVVGLMILLALAAMAFVTLRWAGLLPQAGIQDASEIPPQPGLSLGQYATGLDGWVSIDLWDGTTASLRITDDSGMAISGATVAALSDPDGLTVVAAALGYRPYLGTIQPNAAGAELPAGSSARAAPPPTTIQLLLDAGLHMEESRVHLDHLSRLAASLPGWEDRKVPASDVCDLVGANLHLHEVVLFTGETQRGPHLLLLFPGSEVGQALCTRAMGPLGLSDELLAVSIQELGLEFITLPGHQARGAAGLIFGQVVVRGQMEGSSWGLPDASVRVMDTGSQVLSLANGWYYMETSRTGMLSLVADKGDLVAGPMSVEVQPGQLTHAPLLEVVQATAPPKVETGVVREQDQIAFAAKVNRHESALFLVNDDGTEARRLAAGPGFTGDFAWSPTGQSLAIIVRQEMGNDTYREIYLVPADGSDPARVTYWQAVYDIGWSPDGGRLVFSSQVAGNRDIYSVAANGASLARLTFDPAGDRCPVWSPDGAWIAFLSDRDGAEGGASELYRIREVGGEEDPSSLNRLTFDIGFTDNPEWSPDGTHLVYQSSTQDDPEEDIYLATADGGSQVRLTELPGRSTGPTWSPDGQSIAFYAADHLAPDRASDVYVLTSGMGAGGLPRLIRLTDDPAEDFGPAWSPDGTRIAFVSGRDGPPALYTIKADGTRLAFVTTIDGVWQDHAWRPRATEPAAPTPAATVVPPSPTPAPTSAVPLPDLVVREVRLEYEGGGVCVSPLSRLGTLVELENAGAEAAGPFSVALNGQGWQVAGLGAGEVATFWLPGAMLGTDTTVRIDIDQHVVESDEENNDFSELLALPEPPPPCPHD